MIGSLTVPGAADGTAVVVCHGVGGLSMVVESRPEESLSAGE